MPFENFHRVLEEPGAVIHHGWWLVRLKRDESLRLHHLVVDFNLRENTNLY